MCPSALATVFLGSRSVFWSPFNPTGAPTVPALAAEEPQGAAGCLWGPAQPHSQSLPPQFRKDMASQKKDMHRLSFSALRMQNRDKLFKVSVPHVLELRLPSSSDEYQAARATLVRAFQAKFDTFVVPCVVASGDVKDRKGSEPPSFRCEALELWCPTVAPSVVVTSHKGKTIFNFGDVAVGETLSPTHTSTRCPGTPMPPLAPRPTPDRGAPWGLGLGLGPDAPRPISGHRSIKKVSIQNVSPEDLAVSLSTQPRRPAGWEWGWGGCGGACRHPCPLLDMDPQLDFSLLNPNGPFVLLNHSSLLRAGETQVLVLSFSPHESILAQETLDIITKRSTLTLTLVGTGVASMITCSIEGSILNMGYVIAGESVSSGFKVKHTCWLQPSRRGFHQAGLRPAVKVTRGSGSLGVAS